MDNYIKSLYLSAYMYASKSHSKSELHVCISTILMGVNSFASANSLPSDTPNCLITVYYTIRAFKTVKNIQHAFSLCNVVRVEEHAGGGGGRGGG